MVRTGVLRTERYRAVRLGEVIDAQGRKRRWVADRVGMSEAYLSMIISGERTVDRAQGERICALLGVPFFLLFEFAK